MHPSFHKYGGRIHEFHAEIYMKKGNHNNVCPDVQALPIVPIVSKSSHLVWLAYENVRYYDHNIVDFEQLIVAASEAAVL